MQSNLIYFPTQKRSDKEKNTQWYKDCVDASERIATFNTSSMAIRETYSNKVANYNLANGVIDRKDFEKVVNPLGLKGSTFPQSIQNYPIAIPKLNLLIGEEAKRRFEYKVVVVNPDAITEKEEKKKQDLLQFLVQQAKNESANEQELQAKIQEFGKYQKYSFQDNREIMATHILKYLWYEQKLPEKFNNGFYDALIAAEELYSIDVVANEPVLRKVNPLRLHTLRSGTSPYLEDSDIIVETDYYPIGYIIDNYYEYLTPANIDDIEEGHRNTQGGLLAYKAINPIMNIDEYLYGDGKGLIEVNSQGVRYFTGAYDVAGNVKVTRAVWRGFRRIGILKYFDEFGEQQETVVPDGYRVNENLGEFIEKWLWVTEWYEATKIGHDIYVKMQPRPIQFRKLNNLSSARPGYVGTYYNINSNKARSLFDLMKPYQFLYDAFMYRIDRAFSKYKGPMLEVDFAKIPDEWSMDKWMFTGEETGYLFVDSFREGNKGQAMGKLAGNFNTTGKIYNPEMGNYISHHMEMARMIKEELGEIAGITRQREGATESRETKGGIERAVVQSSLNTEKYYFIHDNLKVRVLSDLLETAKYCYRNSNKKIQYISTDMTPAVLDIDGEQLNETEYGLFVSNALSDLETMRFIENQADRLVTEGRIKTSTIIKMYRSDSISEVAREIEEQEAQAEQQAQQQFQQQQETANMAIAQKAESEQLDRDLKKYEIDTRAETEIAKAEISTYFGKPETDVDNDNIPDVLEISKQALEERKHLSDTFAKEKELKLKEKEHNDAMSLEEKKLKLQEKEMKSKEMIEKLKARTALKNKVSGEKSKK